VVDFNLNGLVGHSETKTVAGVGVLEVTLKNTTGKDITLVPGISLYLYKKGELKNIADIPYTKPVGVWDFLHRTTICATTKYYYVTDPETGKQIKKVCSDTIRKSIFLSATPGTYDCYLVWNQAEEVKDGALVNPRIVGAAYVGTVVHEVDTYHYQKWYTKASLSKFDGTTVYIHFEAINATNSTNSLPRIDIFVSRNGGTPIMRASYRIGETVSSGWYTITTLKAKLPIDTTTGKPLPGTYDVGIGFWYGSGVEEKIQWLGTVTVEEEPKTGPEWADLHDVLYSFKYYLDAPLSVTVGSTVTPKVVIENPTDKVATFTVKWYDDNTCEKTLTVQPHSKAEFPCKITVRPTTTGIIEMHPKVIWNPPPTIHLSGSGVVKTLTWKAFIVDNITPWVVVKWPTKDVTGKDIKEGSLIRVDYTFNNPSGYTMTFTPTLTLVGATTKTLDGDYQVEPRSTGSAFHQFYVPSGLKEVTLKVYARASGVTKTVIYERKWVAPDLPFPIITSQKPNITFDISMPQKVEAGKQFIIAVKIQSDQTVNVKAVIELFGNTHTTKEITVNPSDPTTLMISLKAPEKAGVYDGSISLYAYY